MITCIEGKGVTITIDDRADRIDASAVLAFLKADDDEYVYEFENSEGDLVKVAECDVEDCDDDEWDDPDDDYEYFEVDAE
jgi:hypothetical protein